MLEGHRNTLHGISCGLDDGPEICSFGIYILTLPSWQILLCPCLKWMRNRVGAMGGSGELSLAVRP